MKIRLVPKKKAAPVPEQPERRFFTGCRIDGGDALVEYDTGAEEKVKVYLFDALGHFIAGSEEPAGLLRIRQVRERGGGEQLCQLFVRLPDGSESIEEFTVRL